MSVIAGPSAIEKLLENNRIGGAKFLASQQNCSKRSVRRTKLVKVFCMFPMHVTEGVVVEGQNLPVQSF